MLRRIRNRPLTNTAPSGHPKIKAHHVRPKANNKQQRIPSQPEYNPSTMPPTTTTPPPSEPYYHPLTIDLLVSVLQNSLFHPFIAWLIPLCLLCIGHPSTSPKILYSCYYALSITLLWLLSVLNKRLAYPSPREVDWDTEVVVITGGASGLGRILADVYAMRGASVAVLDVVVAKGEEGDGQEGSGSGSGVRWYRCDVGSEEDVLRCKGEVERDVSSLSPTTLHLSSLKTISGMHCV